MQNAVSGLLLSSDWHDIDQTSELIFWWATAQGPVQTQVRQDAVCFIAQKHQQRAQQLIDLLQWPVRLMPLALRTFKGDLVSACYLPIGLRYRWRDALIGQDITCWELDIRPTDRYLMERFVYGAAEMHGALLTTSSWAQMHAPRLRPTRFVPPLRRLALGLETAQPERDQPLPPITAFVLYAADHCYEVRVGSVEAARALTHQCDQGDAIVWVADEGALLQALLHGVRSYDPDVLLHWLWQREHEPLLQARCAHWHIAFRLGRSEHSAYAGRVMLDVAGALKSATWSLETDCLLTAIEALVPSYGDLAQSPMSLAAQQALSLWDLVEHTHVIPFVIERAHITGLSLDRLGGSVAAFENLYLPRLHRAGYVAPNHGEGYHDQKSPGGWVMDSRPGLFDQVLVLDFKSLYPSIIRTFKIDPMGLQEGMAIADDTANTNTNTSTTVAGFFGGRFHQQRHILPELIRQLGAHREQAKAHKNQPLAQAIKIIMASCYGVLGSEGCRFYDTRLSSSITKRSHEIIQRSADWIETQGYEVIYGDTDSVFVWISGEMTETQTDAIGHQLAFNLNAWWRAELAQQHQIESHLEIEYETHYRRFFMPALRGEETGSKKRYAGWLAGTEDTVVFKGLEAVRSDWTPLAQRCQRYVYQCVFLQRPYRAWLQAQVEALRQGRLDEQLVYRKRLRQPLAAYQKNRPPHAKAAIQLEQWLRIHDRPPRFEQRGGWISYVMTLQGPQPVDVALGLLPSAPLDYQHYIDKQLAPVVDAILALSNESLAAIVDQQLGLRW